MYILPTSTTNHSTSKRRMYTCTVNHQTTIDCIVSTCINNINHSINNIQQQQSQLKEKYEENNPRTYNQYIDVATN